MDGIGSSTQTEAWVVWHSTGPVLGLVWDQVWGLSSGQQRGRLESPGWLEMWLGSSSPDHISFAGFILAHSGHPPCGEWAPGEVSASCVEGGESVHSFVMFPSLEIQQLWRKLYLEEQ